MKHKIILASASKRRSKILKECGIPHKIVKTGIPEKMDHKRGPVFNVLHNACLKAEKASSRLNNGYVIGADTVVLLGKRLIGKPKTRKEAKTLLKVFSGKTILVYTGICVIDAKTKKCVKNADMSKVTVRKLSPEEIERFVVIAGPHDKAGGFSIEGPGSFIFDRVEGSFYNILGLSTIKLRELFKRLGTDLL